MKAQIHSRGFTLIEMSIVLIIIGLIVGGILVGQDLMGAAAIRAQITQVEKYNVAVNNFKNKYGGIPGDLNATLASQFGFVARAGTQGRGDGDGILEGYNYSTSQAYTCSTANNCYITGEPLFFWEDLSAAGMIEGVFNLATDALYSWGNWCLGCSPNGLSLLFPSARIGNTNFVYVYSSGGYNYFAVLGITDIQNIGVIALASPSLTVAQAAAIDKKTDDGFPLSGKVLVQAFTNTNWWSNAGGTVSGAWDGGNVGWLGMGNAPGTSTPGTTTTCYDNGGTTGTMQYSTEENNGSGLNCALSFQMQGAAR